MEVFNEFYMIVIIIGVVLLSAIVACLYAFILYRKIKQIEVLDQKMTDISSYIHQGALAFMKREYRIIFYFAIGVASILALTELIPSLRGAEGVGWRAAISFFFGALFSALAGWIGMLTATKSNHRTAYQAKVNGMPGALKTSFTGGSVLGLTVVGLGLFGLTMLFFIFFYAFGGASQEPREQYLALTHAIHSVTGYGLGASLIALFGRVGGGIFTKAADVGADLVGKIESNIPEDDPRNPAVIADNVGDNVGDIAGMGSDLTESFVGSIISALTLGLYAFVMFSPEIVSRIENFVITRQEISSIIAQVMFPLILASIGVVASIMSIMMIRMRPWKRPQFALNLATYISVVIVFILTIIISHLLFETFRAWQLIGAVSTGLVVGISIGLIAEYYTSKDFPHVKEIAKQSQTGHATNVIEGFSVGMRSTGLTVLLFAVGMVIAYVFTADMYGIAIAAVGMLSTVGITISVDAYGPISDNAGGIAEMSHQSEVVRKVTDELDAVGNTTAAIGKGFCIGSAALTSIGLFFAFEKSAGLSETSGVDILQPGVLIGIFIGAMLPYLFTSIVIKSVGRTAHLMIEEVRRQYQENPSILKGDALPDYAKCVDIATKASLKEMILPALLAIGSPLFFGIFLGAQGLGGLLVGGLVSSIMLAVFMANAGGAWDNAKKLIESGYMGGKGSETHKASITGDTVGDPFKDTAGPSMDILIKLMSMMSLIIVPVLKEIEPLLSFLFH